MFVHSKVIKLDSKLITFSTILYGFNSRFISLYSFLFLQKYHYITTNIKVSIY